MVAGRRLGDIGAAVEGIAEAAGFTVVREYVGHGIGTAMHEEPQVPNYGPAGRGLKLKEGIVLAIEPMVNAGGPETEVLDDGWTVITRDGRRSAHFEHTIAVTEHGPEVLTLPDLHRRPATRWARSSTRGAPTPSETVTSRRPSGARAIASPWGNRTSSGEGAAQGTPRSAEASEAFRAQRYTAMPPYVRTTATPAVAASAPVTWSAVAPSPASSSRVRLAPGSVGTPRGPTTSSVTRIPLGDRAAPGAR